MKLGEKKQSKKHKTKVSTHVMQATRLEVPQKRIRMLSFFFFWLPEAPIDLKYSHRNCNYRSVPVHQPCSNGISGAFHCQKVLLDK